MHADPFGLVGVVLDGRYRVDAVVGEGGFGVVYRAHHLAFDHGVAVKCLKLPSHFEASARAVFLDKFREEGRILSRLSEHPSVVRVLDFGVREAGGLVVPFLVLEWLEGETLADMLERRGALPAREAVELFLPAVSAVAFAHEARVAHRDLKPENLFVTRTRGGPLLKVLDFGIAKALQDGETQAASTSRTSSGFHAFSPRYGAPEQFSPKRFGPTSPRTDVHALGLVLFELLAGERALAGDEYAELLEAVLAAERPTLASRGARVPDELARVCERAMSRDPEARYADAGQLYAALSEASASLAKRDVLASPDLALAPRGEPIGHAPGEAARTAFGAPLEQALAVPARERAVEATRLEEAVGAVSQRSPSAPLSPATPREPTRPKRAKTRKGRAGVPGAPPPGPARQRAGATSRDARLALFVVGPLVAIGLGAAAYRLATEPPKKRGRASDETSTDREPTPPQATSEREPEPAPEPTPSAVSTSVWDSLTFKPPAERAQPNTSTDRAADPTRAPVDVANPPPEATKTPSGLAYRMLRMSQSRVRPGPTSRVKVHYAGWTSDGRLFDASYTRGQPATFPLDGVIKGWTEGLQTMVVGERKRFWIPASLAYGTSPRAGAPAGQLTFDVELLEVL